MMPNVYLAAISWVLRLSREQRTHEGLVGVLQQLLVLGHHKVLVLHQEVVCLVAHAPSIVLDLEACLDQLWLGEALAALDFRRVVQAVGKINICRL